MRGMRDVAKEVAPVLQSGSWEDLALLVDKNWQYQLLLDATMSTPHLRAIEAKIRDAGAWAVKATGEGAGGCFLVVCPPDRREAIASAAAECGGSHMDVLFSFEGVTVTESADDARAT